MYKNSRGFTIVELLIVIVVIGILAAIVIVAFNGVQQRANTAAVTSDLSTFKKKLEMLRTDSTSGNYTTSDAASGGLGALDMRVSRNSYMTGSAAAINLLYCTTAPISSDYALLAMTKDGVKLYVSSKVSGVQEYTGTNSWNASNYPERCQTVLNDSTNTARAGYSQGDSTTGPWRPWTGTQ